MRGKLLVVGTPIGNLSDMSPRVAQALADADFIAAEDTRVTVKLLNHLGIKKSMVSYFEHNKHERGNLILSRIRQGQVCALVSDAGMPTISDPGEELVGQCIEDGIAVEVIPGPTAVMSALAISGLKASRFTFEGFLSVNKKNREKHLLELRDEVRTMIFYEAPHKFKNTVRDLYRVLGNRKVAIARELTKVHEEVIRTDLASASSKYSEEAIRGEIVLIVEGAEPPVEKGYSLDEARDMARGLINEGVKTSDAAKRVAEVTGLKKSDIYKGVLGE